MPVTRHAGQPTQDLEEHATMSDTMTVTVRDRTAESPWGSGPLTPVTRQITISAFCPRCGLRRGQPNGLNQHDDGAWYWVQTWTNPCGHVDMYADVLREAGAVLHRPATH